MWRRTVSGGPVVYDVRYLSNVRNVGASFTIANRLTKYNLVSSVSGFSAVQFSWMVSHFLNDSTEPLGCWSSSSISLRRMSAASKKCSGSVNFL